MDAHIRKPDSAKIPLTNLGRRYKVLRLKVAHRQQRLFRSTAVNVPASSHIWLVEEGMWKQQSEYSLHGITPKKR